MNKFILIAAFILAPPLVFYCCVTRCCNFSNLTCIQHLTITVIRSTSTVYQGSHSVSHGLQSSCQPGCVPVQSSESFSRSSTHGRILFLVASSVRDLSQLLEGPTCHTLTLYSPLRAWHFFDVRRRSLSAWLLKVLH